MKKEERIHDRAIEKLVAKELREQLRPQTEGCPDTETLAAYVDDTLGARERQHWESHLAQCSRCQEQVATLVRWRDADEHLEQPAPARARTFVLFRWAWAAPLLLAAVVAGLWYGGEFRNLLRQTPETKIEGPPLTPAPATPTAPEEPRVASTVVMPNKTTEADSLTASNSFKGPRARQESAEEEGGISATIESAVPEVAAKGESAPAAQALQVAPTPAMKSRQPAPAVGTKAARTTDAYLEAMEAPASGRGGASVREKEAEKLSLAPPLPPADAKRKIEANSPSTISLATGLAPESLPTSSPEIWRVGPDGLIQKRDATGNWNTVPSGVTADLYCIRFPSPNVGWAVGQSGLILRTIDQGKTWKRIAAPTNQDLIKVTASSARSAQIETRSGQLWLTVDGGENWVKPLPE